MKPQINNYPAFQANQVLTADALNSAVDYLLQQEQYTRNKFVGIGIACGLTIEKVTIPVLGIIIHEGCGISSAGALAWYQQPRSAVSPNPLLPYTHARQFKDRDGKFIVGEREDEFKGLVNLSNDAQKSQIRELVTTSEFDANKNTKGGAVLTPADLIDNVIVLYFDDFNAKTGGCLDENCDEKGMMHELALKPLLIPKTVIDSYLGDGATQKSPERVRYLDFQNDKLNSINYLQVNQLSFNETGRVQLKNVNNIGELQLLFEEAINGKSSADTSLLEIGQAVSRLKNEFSWLFDTQLKSATVTPFFNDASGNLFSNAILNNLTTATNLTQIQYAYDFVRDVVEAHNDLYEKISDLIAICCPDEWMFPNHLMLGIVDSPPTFSQFDATKFFNPNLKYRHIFSPAFTDVLQRELRDEIYSKIERLNALLNAFDLNAIKNKSIPLILPSFDYDKDMEERVIPAYYNNSVTSKLNLYWNFENTKRNKTARNTFFDKFTNENEPFRFDWMKNDFFRIEGHIGKPFATVHPLIENIRKNNNLPFEIKTIALSLAATIHECAMPDLQEDYDFQRRKILAILKRLLKKIIDFHKTTSETKANSTQDPTKFEEDKKLLLELIEQIIKIVEIVINILKEPCISRFDYLTLKKAYERLWFLIVEYAQKQDPPNIEDKAENKENINLLITAINLFLFGALYKIYIALEHRKELMKVNKIDTLKELATKYTGLEHLAGVRRGETLLLVHDGGTIVADFNLPYQIPCECGCVEETCDTKKSGYAQPMGTPMIMFVNLSKISENVPKDHSISFFEEDLLMGDDSLKEIIFSNRTGTNPIVTNRLSAKKIDETEWSITYTPDFKNDPDGWHQVNYILHTNQGQGVEGTLFVGIVGGKQAFEVRNVGLNVNVSQTSGFKPEPLLTRSQFDVPPQVEFKGGGTISTESIGGVPNISILTTPNKNLIIISRDNQNFPQFQVFRLNPVAIIEEFDFEVTFNGQSVKGKGTLNVTPQSSPTGGNIGSIKGVLLDNAGLPIAKARVFNTVKGVEAFTNDKGEYEIAADKAGELILFQKDGFDDFKLQAGINTQFTMNKKQVRTDFFDVIKNDNLIKIIGPKNLRNIAK